MILREGLSLTLIGSAVGLIVAPAISRVLAEFLFGFPRIDPLTFTGTAVLFVAIGLAACYVPARRATRVDAMESLSHAPLSACSADQAHSNSLAACGRPARGPHRAQRWNGAGRDVDAT
jgi:hypothetical protein